MAMMGGVEPEDMDVVVLTGVLVNKPVRLTAWPRSGTVLRTSGQCSRFLGHREAGLGIYYHRGRAWDSQKLSGATMVW